MGNFHSSWNRQPNNSPSLGNQPGDPDSPNDSSRRGVDGGTNDENTLRNPYNLRRTLSRLRRTRPTLRQNEASRSRTGDESNSSEINNNSEGRFYQRFLGRFLNHSSSSLGLRRSAREMLAENGGQDDPQPRRARIESLRRTMFTPEADDANSLFFFLPIPPAYAGGQGTSPTASQPSSEMRHMVFVRVRQLHPDEGLTRGQPENAAAEDNSNHADAIPAGANNTNPDETGGSPGNQSDGRDAYVQWTLYFMTPLGPDGAIQSSLPPFDAQATAQRAFAVLRAMMAGDNMTYEDWIRLQETLGNQNRGVTKEQIDAVLSTITYSQFTSADLGQSCPICLTDFVTDEKLRVLPCSHYYHADCIDTWLTSINSCPLCRRQPAVFGPPSTDPAENTLVGHPPAPSLP